MLNHIINQFTNNKDTIVLYLQVFCTFIIGILAWTVSRNEYCLSEKRARQELYKLRYENIYVAIKDLFSNCINLTKEYEIIKKIENEKNRIKSLNTLKQKYLYIRECFYKNIDSNRFLIKRNDYETLSSYCEKFLSHVFKYINEEQDNEICSNYYIVADYNQHLKVIDKILSPYFYYGKEDLSFLIYKIWKYIKKHFHLFLIDYFPTFCEIFSSIIFIFLFIAGLLYAYIEIAKEYLKAPIKLKKFRLKFELKMKSEYLKRNRPWPL